MGELLALKWEDEYEDHIRVRRTTAIVVHTAGDGSQDRYREVWDTKTENSVRDIPIIEDTYRMLTAHRLAQKKFCFEHGLKQSGYVFTNQSGELIDASNLRVSYKRLLERAGVPYRKFHTIRHTFATEAIRKGVPVKDLQMLMGHADITTTYIYVQPDNESKREAIEKIGVLL